MNDFIDAIKNNSNNSGKDSDGEGDASEERYNQLKKEEADVEQGTPAEQRYSEIKEKAKKEMIRQERKEELEEEAGEDEDDSGDEQGFITH